MTNPDGAQDSGTVVLRQLRPRKPYSKGVARAMALLERLAQTIHQNQLRGVVLEGISGASVLQDLLELQHFVYGEGAVEPLSVYHRLAVCEAELGHHEEAIAVLQQLLDKQRARLGDKHLEIARLLRLMANSFDKLERPADSQAARQEAVAIVAEQLGKPDLVALLSGLVGDEVRATVGGEATVAEAFAGQEPAASTKGQEVPKPRRGDIWWVQFPQYPNDPHQPRPAVVVSVDHRNERADKVQVVPLSSTNNGHRMNYAIPKGGSGLQYDSCAKCGDITAVAKTMLSGTGPIGKVPKPIVDGIVELAQQALRC